MARSLEIEPLLAGRGMRPLRTHPLHSIAEVQSFVCRLRRQSVLIVEPFLLVGVVVQLLTRGFLEESRENEENQTFNARARYAV